MAASGVECVVIEPNSSMQQCTDTYGIEGEGEWVNNSVSRYAEFWSCGMIARQGALTRHYHEAEEFRRCQALGAEAAKIMGPTWSWLRSSADPETHPFHVVAQQDATVPARIDESLVRAVFGGTLHPGIFLYIEPFVEGSPWWQVIEDDATKSAADHPEWYNVQNILRPWRELVAWFPRNALAHPTFVNMDDMGPVEMTLGCVYPNLVFGITDKGSLIGILTHVVG